MLHVLSHNKINKSVSETHFISFIHIKEQIIDERLYYTTALNTQRSCEDCVLNWFLISLFIKLVFKSNNTLAIVLSEFPLNVNWIILTDYHLTAQRVFGAKNDLPLDNNQWTNDTLLKVIIDA